MSFSVIPYSPLSGIKQYEDHIDKSVYLRNLRRSTNELQDINYLILKIYYMQPQNKIVFIMRTTLNQ